MGNSSNSGVRKPDESRRKKYVVDDNLESIDFDKIPVRNFEDSLDFKASSALKKPQLDTPLPDFVVRKKKIKEKERMLPDYFMKDLEPHFDFSHQKSQIKEMVDIFRDRRREDLLNFRASSQAKIPTTSNTRFGSKTVIADHFSQGMTGSKRGIYMPKSNNTSIEKIDFIGKRIGDVFSKVSNPRYQRDLSFDQSLQEPVAEPTHNLPRKSRSPRFIYDIRSQSMPASSIRRSSFKLNSLNASHHRERSNYLNQKLENLDIPEQGCGSQWTKDEPSQFLRGQRWKMHTQAEANLPFSNVFSKSFDTRLPNEFENPHAPKLGISDLPKPWRQASNEDCCNFLQPSISDLYNETSVNRSSNMSRADHSKPSRFRLADQENKYYTYIRSLKNPASYIAVSKPADRERVESLNILKPMAKKMQSKKSGPVSVTKEGNADVISKADARESPDKQYGEGKKDSKIKISKGEVKEKPSKASNQFADLKIFLQGCTLVQPGDPKPKRAPGSALKATKKKTRATSYHTDVTDHSDLLSPYRRKKMLLDIPLSPNSPNTRLKRAAR